MNNHGTTSLEILVGFALVTLTIALTTPFLKNTMQLEKKFREHAFFHTHSATLFQIYSEGVGNADSLLGVPSLRLHEEGDMQDIFFNSIPLTHEISSTHAPLSFLHLDTSSPLFTLKRKRNGSKVDLTLCYRGQPKPPGITTTLRNFRAWLAVSLDNTQEVELNIAKIKNGGSQCSGGKEITASATPLPQQIFANHTFWPLPKSSALENLLGTQALVPIKESYALYLDNKNQLRRVSHISKSSQVVLENIVSLNHEIIGGILKIQFQVKHPEKNDFKKAAFSLRLPKHEKTSLLDLVL